MSRSNKMHVKGNITGSIFVGGHAFVVNTDHGAVIQKRAAPKVKLRQPAPQPPPAFEGFVNRAVELTKLENWIASNEIVLLHAPDGMGKTALLRQAVNGEAARAMPNGVVLLESPGFESQSLGADDVFQQLFDVLFESNPPLKVDSVTARAHLADLRPIVVLDEVPLPPMLQRALPDLIPQGTFLLSADLPTGGDFQRLAVGPLPRDESVRLLAERADITPDETLKFICGLLEDVALAVIVTGNLMRESGMTPEETLTALGVIQVGGMDPFAIALDRAYMLVINKLGSAERKILSVAALTPGVSMSPEWLGSILGANIYAALERLEKLGLLCADGARLRLPIGFRAIARRRAQLDEDVVFSQLTTYLLGGAEQGQAFINSELGNFLGALDWAARTGRSADVIALGKLLDPFLTLSGLWDAWSKVLDAVLNAALRLGDRAAEAWALHQLGTRLIGLENIPKATEFLNRAQKLRLKLGDEAGAIHSRQNLEVLFPLTRPIRNASRFSLPRRILLVVLGLLLATAFMAWMLLMGRSGLP